MIRMNKIIDKLTYKILSRWKYYIRTKEKKKARNKILTYYSQTPSNSKEISDAVQYISSHPLTTFFGVFQEKYLADKVKVYTDHTNGLPYVITDSKKLYFKRSHNKRTVQLMFNSLIIEQDDHSPHCYTDNDFQVINDEILADIGCAEGYFSLINIEKSKKVYLFEHDTEWIEALEATFTPWKDKIRIIPKFVSDKNNSNEISLDNYFMEIDEKPSFYKIDVEGAEASVLKGMKVLLREPVKVALCTYHNHHDYDIFSRFFEDNLFHYRPNSGVMIYQNDLKRMEPPFFRKCMIKATNQYD